MNSVETANPPDPAHHVLYHPRLRLRIDDQERAACLAECVNDHSNNYLWSAIVGTNSVHGAASDVYASGTSSAQHAATYCASSYSFSGVSV